MFEIKVFDTIYDENLKKDWSSLQNGEDMTAFQHYEWYCMLEEEFNSNKMKKMFGKIQYYEVFENGNPVIIAPMHIQRHTLKIGPFGYEKGIYFLGMRGYSDYLNFIYTEINDEQIDYLLKCLLDISVNKALLLSELRDNSKISRVLSTGCIHANVERLNWETCVNLEMPDSSEAFFKGMSKQFRQNYRTQKHRCDNDGIAIEYVFHQGCFSEESVISEILRIHEDRFDNKNKKNKAVKLSTLLSKIRGSFDEITYSLKNDSDSWLLLGYINNKLVSYIYGLSDDYAVRIMQLGFLKNYSKYSPGITILIDYLLQNYEKYQGKSIDFTRGDEAYKFRMGGTEHRISSFIVRKA